MSNVLKRRGKEKRKKLEAGLAGDMLPPGTMLVSFKKYIHLSGQFLHLASCRKYSAVYTL